MYVCVSDDVPWYVPACLRSCVMVAANAARVCFVMLRWACCTIALASNAAGTDVPAVGVSVVFVVAVEAMMGGCVVLFGVLQ